MREVCFPDFCGIAYGNRDDRTLRLGSDLKAAFMERKHIQLICIFVARSFRENTDGDAGLYFFHSSQDSLQPLLDIISVKKKAVKIFHPDGKQRNFFHFFFGNIAGTDGTAAVGQEDVKITPVIAYVQDRGVLWYILFSYNGYPCSGEPENEAKNSLDNPKRTEILLHGGKFADDPLNNEKRDG